jgi:hypothetical protein
MEVEPEAVEDSAPTEQDEAAVEDAEVADVEPEPEAEEAVVETGPDADAPTPPDMERFVTSTGKVIFVNISKVTTAKSRRKVIRGVTKLIVVLAMLAVVATIIVLINKLGSSAEPPVIDKRAAILKASGYNPEENPFYNQNANMLGIALGESTAVILDGNGGSRPWLGIATEAALVGLTKCKPEQTAAVLIASDDGVFAYPNQPRRWTPGYRDQAVRFFDSHPAGGGSTLSDAIKRAVKMKVTDIILVTSQNIDETDSAGLSAALGEGSKVRFSAMFIDAASASIKALVAKTNGRYVAEISSSRIATWYQDYSASPEKDKQLKLSEDDASKGPPISSGVEPTTQPATEPSEEPTRPAAAKPVKPAPAKPVKPPEKPADKPGSEGSKPASEEAKPAAEKPAEPEKAP